MERIELEAMMKTDPNEIMTWNGRTRTVGEHLRAIFKGEDSAVVAPRPAAAPQPAGAGPAGLQITFSQAAMNSISEAHYKELQETGEIPGLTTSDNGRYNVRVSAAGGIGNSGAQVFRYSIDPESNKVGPGRPMDTRMFYDPDAPAGS